MTYSGLAEVGLYENHPIKTLRLCKARLAWYLHMDQTERAMLIAKIGPVGLQSGPPLFLWTYELHQAPWARE